MEYLYLYTILINVFGFLLMGIDKKRAKNRQYRISEKTLWLITILGAGIGTTLAMYAFRHKTKHLIFLFGFPMIGIVQVGLLFYFS